MKNTLLLILGYYLVIQAGCGVLSACGRPEHAVLILAISGLLGWGGYEAIKRGRCRPAIEHPPNTALDTLGHTTVYTPPGHEDCPECALPNTTSNPLDTDNQVR